MKTKFSFDNFSLHPVEDQPLPNWRIRTFWFLLACAYFGLMLFFLTAIAFAHDWFSDMKNHRNDTCCSGQDCVVYEGTPERVNGAWKFGEHVIQDDQLIKVELVPLHMRGQHILCVFRGKSRCGYVAGQS